MWDACARRALTYDDEKWMAVDAPDGASSLPCARRALAYDDEE